MNAPMLVTVIVAALVGSSATLVTARWVAPLQQLATVDAGVLVAEHLQEMAPGLDEAAITARSRAYAQRLDAAVARVAKKYNVVLLVKPSVITGAPDLTDAVREQLHGAR